MLVVGQDWQGSDIVCAARACDLEKATHVLVGQVLILSSSLQKQDAAIETVNEALSQQTEFNDLRTSSKK